MLGPISSLGGTCPTRCVRLHQETGKVKVCDKKTRSSLTNVDFPHSESQRLNILEAGRDREDVYAQYVQPLQICKDIHGKAFR